MFIFQLENQLKEIHINCRILKIFIEIALIHI